ncbi:pyridoxal phosphate-dependent aminotransferase [Sulfitobacter sp. F26204]|uniref:pyridoxal phosphate-dependent aminotransferase n=1 Tax=Sulfitobacter sp. F26204 TaxID=2996014 RepID=UPI00225E6FB4|nr:pyridoxal phosphate-dependent aminotransferase [Sulfitobacter sp. F26204]MCX7561459.1 pyridoxal phosphate-dependent aminotransferase [Sulfitobacter sp. F26204]
MHKTNTGSMVLATASQAPRGEFLSKRARALKVSPTIAMSQRAGEMRADGIDVVNLSVGEPDTPTPMRIVDAAHEAAKKGHTRYTAPDGHQRVKQAVQTKLLRDNKLAYDLNQIGVVSGCKQAIFNALAATIDVGDEVVLIAPYWVSYADMVTYHGGTPVVVTAKQEDGFLPDIRDIAAALTPRTKWVLLNSPNNPTGAVYPCALLRQIGDLLAQHPDVMVLSDEIYEHLTYDGAEFVSFASALPDLKDRILLVNGASKAYSMTGWRVGFAAGPAWLIGAMARVQSQAAGSSNMIAQFAAVEAMEGDQSDLQVNRQVLKRRRDTAIQILSKCTRLGVCPLGGAFYIFADIHKCLGLSTADGRVIKTDSQMSDFLLDQAHVATVPGVEFGCSPYIRLSFAVDDDDLTRACNAIVAACNSLKLPDGADQI